MDKTVALLTVQAIKNADGTVIVQLKGEIDVSSGQILIDAFRIIAEEHSQDVILDASGISFMDSTGVHALVDGKRMIHDHGTNIVLVPSSQMRRVLDLVLPEPLFAARVNTVKEALALVQSLHENLATESDTSGHS